MLEYALPKVLVVDDDPAVRSYLRQALAPLTTYVSEAANASDALAAIESGDYDITLCDIWMPGASGFDLLAMAHQSQWDMAFILITGQVKAESVVEALRLGASDFLLKPFTLNALTASITRTHRQLLAAREARQYKGSLEASIEQRTRDLEAALRQVELNYRTTLEALVLALDAREHETCAHSMRVRAYTLHLARLVGCPPAIIPALEHAALLHDIGKIAVADAILLKPGKLTTEDWVEMKKHSAAGEQILRRIPFLKPASAIVRHHHERFDGTGYPDGLRGEEIPLGARLFAFADTLDAMTSARPYRPTPGFAAAREEIFRYAGTQFDPSIAQVFLEVPETTWQKIRDEVSRGEAGESHDETPHEDFVIAAISDPLQ
jgi:putative nucleotidyltransferase with HDIG domain